MLEKLDFSGITPDNMTRQWIEPTKCQLDLAAYKLESCGFRKSIAGSELFNRAAYTASSAWHNNLGIFVYGPPGTGKTLFLRSAFKPVRETSFTTYFVNLKKPGTEAMIDPRKSDVDALCDMNVIIDDLGCENPSNEFGVRYEPAIEFIMYHWARNEKRPPGTRFWVSVSTNLNEQTIDRYSDRINFFKEIMIPINFGGESHRDWGGKIK